MRVILVCSQNQAQYLRLQVSKGLSKSQACLQVVVMAGGDGVVLCGIAEVFCFIDTGQPSLRLLPSALGWSKQTNAANTSYVLEVFPCTIHSLFAEHLINLATDGKCFLVKVTSTGFSSNPSHTFL